MISKVQQIHLDLIRLASFNEMDGDQIVDDLLTHENLWQAAMMANYGITLRDLPKDYFNVCELYVTVPKDQEINFLDMASEWKADELYRSTDSNWNLASTFIEKQFVVYRLWWD